MLSNDELGLVDDIVVEVGSDLFIVGFPSRFGDEYPFPIWKRGTVSSEPLIKPQGLSKFYIDAHTTGGMSGSPVFATEQRLLYDIDKETYDLYQKFQAGQARALDFLDRLHLNDFNAVNHRLMRFVGIYSGRVEIDGKLDPEIGVVWSKDVLEELFTSPVISHHPYPPS